MRKLVLLVVAAAGLAAVSVAFAAWTDGGYQWNTRTPFTVTLTDSTTGAWPARVAKAVSDWNTVAAGVASFKVGRNGKALVQDGYGSGSPCAYTQFRTHSGHVAAAFVFLDDTCQDGRTEFWKQFAVCQELGHVLGLPDYNLNPLLPSCMAPSNPADHPSSEDVQKLRELYG